jgi:hypothetical protein
MAKTSLTKATLSFILISVKKAMVLGELNDLVVPFVCRASTLYFSMEARSPDGKFYTRTYGEK